MAGLIESNGYGLMLPCEKCPLEQLIREGGGEFARLARAIDGIDLKYEFANNCLRTKAEIMRMIRDERIVLIHSETIITGVLEKIPADICRHFALAPMKNMEPVYLAMPVKKGDAEKLEAYNRLITWKMAKLTDGKRTELNISQECFDSFFPEPTSELGADPLTIDALAGLWTILACGFIVSLSVFGIEFYCATRKQNQQQDESAGSSPDVKKYLLTFKDAKFADILQELIHRGDFDVSIVGLQQ